MPASKTPASKIMVVDVGGSHVKIMLSGGSEIRKVKSGPKMNASKMVEKVLTMAEGWRFNAISMGFPGVVHDHRIQSDPPNMGKGWVGFDFAHAFGCKVKIVNDALMQAIGSYEGGRMLFLGLGTGLGSALIMEKVAQPMELAHLPYRDGLTFEDFVGVRGLNRLGLKAWKNHTKIVIAMLQAALQPDYVVIGGGNVKRFKTLPSGWRRGDNANAFRGGFRLWDKNSIRI